MTYIWDKGEGMKNIKKQTFLRCLKLMETISVRWRAPKFILYFQELNGGQLIWPSSLQGRAHTIYPSSQIYSVCWKLQTQMHILSSFL